MSNKKWTKNEIAYLVENYGRMSLEDMAIHLNRSVMAVRLYALRHRLDDKHQVVKENRLKKLLEYRFRHLEDFHPSKFFFRETGINQVILGSVLRAEVNQAGGIQGCCRIFQYHDLGGIRFPSA